MKKSLIPIFRRAMSALVFIPTALWAQVPSDADRWWGCGPHMSWPGGGWFGMISGPLFLILVLAGLIALVILLLRWLGGASHGAAWHQGAPSRTALDILKERYARGEINQDEFEERRRVLRD